MAVARYKKDILASSNLKDIKEYCEKHEIMYLTTMDFLCEAIKKKILTIKECDEFIQRVLGAKSKLPVSKMALYNCKELHFTR